MFPFPILAATLLVICGSSTAATVTPASPPFYVDMPLDHFGGAQGTYKNRYFMNDTFYKDGGPVFLYDAGEGSAALSIESLGRGASFDLAQRFGGILILWEHRYYGSSYPQKGFEESLSPNASANYYKYLTVEQALEDVAVFAKNFSIAGRTQNLKPSAVPWVFIGGSYPGNRAAWSRTRNPEVVFASLSSSAPVQAQTDFWQYFVAIERLLANTPDYASCLTDLHAIVQWMTNIYNLQQVSLAEAFIANATYAVYQGKYATTLNTTAAWHNRAVLMDIIASRLFDDFQYKGLNGSLGQVCLALKESHYTGDSKATAADLKNGIVAHYGLNFSLAVYSKIISDLLSQSGGLDSDSDSAATFDIDLSHMNNFHLVKDVSLISKRQSSSLTSIEDTTSWTYQTCSELGYFQTGNASRATNIVPGFINVEYYINTWCIPSFGDSVSQGPDPSVLNNKYGGWHLNATNIFSTNGQYDPWRALSVASDVSASNPDRSLTSTVPKAGVLPADGQWFGHVIINGLHCSDLSYNAAALPGIGSTGDLNGTDTDDSALPDASVAHELFASALSSWLPAFKPFAASATPKASSTIVSTASVAVGTTAGGQVGTVASTGTPTGTAAVASTSKPGAAGKIEVNLRLSVLGTLLAGLTMLLLI